MHVCMQGCISLLASWGVLVQRVQHQAGRLVSDPVLALCAQLEAAQLNGQLERGQRQVADVERTFMRLKQSYEERKKGEKDLMDQTRNEFNQYFGLCAPHAAHLLKRETCKLHKDVKYTACVLPCT